MTNEMLTAEAVEEWTGVPVATLKAWRRQGRGPKSFRLGNGRHTRYMREDVAAWIEAQRVLTGSGNNAA